MTWCHLLTLIRIFIIRIARRAPNTQLGVKVIFGRLRRTNANIIRFNATGYIMRVDHVGFLAGLAGFGCKVKARRISITLNISTNPFL